MIDQARGAKDALSLIYRGNRREFGWLFALFRSGEQEQISAAQQRMRSLFGLCNKRNRRNAGINGSSLIWDEKVLASHHRIGHLLARYRTLEKGCVRPRMTPEEVISIAGPSLEESLVKCCDVTMRGSGLVPPKVQDDIDYAAPINRTAEPLN